MNISQGTNLGPYQIQELVGSGGMGEVYRARDRRLGRHVAVKVLPASTATDRDRLGRFEREARLASSLNHPNIVTIYDIGEENSVPYIAMELVEGKTLREILVSGPIPARRLVAIALQIADALAKAHESGIVHRDLKPENVMVTDDGVVKILDFGLGKNSIPPLQYADSTILAAPDPTHPGTVLGTADYMSPEQASGKETDFQSDQFSLGSIIYEMASGRRAFRRETAVQTMSAIITEDPPVLAASTVLQAPLLEIVSRCLEKAPKNRYATTRDLATELRELAAVLEVSSAGLSRIVTTFSVAQRRRARWKRIIGVVASLAVIGGVLLTPSLRRPLLERLRISTPLPVSKNLVILPFQTMADTVDQQFATGLTEAVTTALTPLTIDPSLQMSPASEVTTRGVTTAEDARKILAANLVLSGTVDRQGDTLSVSWSLDDAATLQRLRSRTISVKASEPLELESRTIEAIVDTLGLTLNPAQREALLVPDTRIPAAKEAYLRGRGFLYEYDKRENVARAIVLFEEARTADPNYAKAYAGLGEAYWRQYERLRTKDWIDRALEACQRAIRINEKAAVGHGCLGAVFFTVGSHEDALKEYYRALEIEPWNDDFRRQAARSEEQLGRLDNSESTLKDAIQLRPQYWANYNGLGGFYFNRGRYSDAAEMFSRVIQLAPDTVFGYANLGGTLAKLGRYDEAIPMLERAASIRPTGTALSNLGTTYFQRRRFSEAATTFEKATKADERNYAVWGNLGDAYYWAAGKRSESTAAYRIAIALGQEALKVNPRDATLLSRIAQYYGMMEERSAALSNLRRALEIAPNDAEVLFKAALVYNQFKQDDQTLEWLEKAARAGYSITMIRDARNFDHLWAYPKFQDLIRKY